MLDKRKLICDILIIIFNIFFFSFVGANKFGNTRESFTHSARKNMSIYCVSWSLIVWHVPHIRG